MINIFDYTKNIAKSVMYSSVDTLADSAPTTKEFISTNRDVISSLYSSMRDLRKIRKRATNYVNNSKLYEAADAGIKAVFEDIKTGKFYNRERISKFEDKVASSMLGDGFDFDDSFNTDFDTSSSDSSNDASIGDLEATVALSSKDNAEAVSSTVARVGSHISSTNRTNTMMLLNQQIKANNIMEKGFSSIFERIGEVGKINSDIAATHAENSKKFFEVSTTLMQEQTNILREILALQKANAPVAPTKSSSSSSAPKFSDIVGYNGEVNLKAYGKNIVNNFKNSLPASLNMINSLGGENSNPFLMFAASPLQFIPNYIAKTLIPKVTRKAVEDFDKTLSGAFSGIMATLKKMENNYSFGEDYFKTEIGRYIGRVFGISTARPENPNPKNYNKGNMPWNGLAQKSITEVIPGYLRRIESILSGDPERVYSYSKGKWTSGYTLRRERDEMSEGAYREAYRDIKYQMTELLRDSAAYSSEQWKNINDQMTNFLKTIVESDYGNPKFKVGDERKFAKYKVNDEETMKLLLAAFNATDRRERAQLARKSFQARDTLANRLNNLFTDNAEMVELFNGSDVDKGYNPSWTSGGKKRNSAPGFIYNSTIDKILDDKGHNVFYYLQHIYDEFVTFRVNGYGGSGTGYDRASQIRRNDIPVVVDAAAARGNRYTRIRSRRPVAADRYREINPLMPGVSPEQAQHDAEARARYEEEERFNRWAHDNGRQIFNAYDSGSNSAIYSNIKNRGKEWYGDANYETYKNSRSVREFLDENETLINKNYNKSKDKRRSKIATIDERVFGDVTYDNPRGKKPKLFDRLAAAENITEKMAIFTNSVDNLLEAPQKFLTNIMLKADQRLYELVFGSDEQHYVNGKPVNGVMGEMIYQIKGTFSKLNDWFDEKVLNPLRNKGIHGPGDVIQYIGEMFGVDLKGTKDSIANWLFKKNGFVKGVGSNLRDAAGAFGKFMSDRGTQAANGVPSIDPIREAHHQNISNRIKQRQNNINFFNMMKDYSDYLGYGPDFERDEAGTLLKIAKELYGEYTPVENINEVSSDFIRNFINNTNDSRLKGKSSLSDIKKSVTSREYRDIAEAILSQYNADKKGQLDKNRSDMMALAAAVPGLDLNSDILRALADDSMTKAMVGSKLRFYQRHNDYAANYNHANPSANKYSDDSRKSFIRDKNNRLSILDSFGSITGKYRSVDRIASDVEQLLAENPDALAQDLRNKIIDKLDDVYASDAERINDKFDINKIISDSDNGEAIIDKIQLNKLLRRINGAVNNFNNSNAGNLTSSLIAKIQELTDNKSSAYNAEEAGRLGLNLKFDDAGRIIDIANTPEEIIKILANERSAISNLATGTRYVTKTGLTTIHEGEMVIPSELNPLNPNRGRVSKSTEIANENRVKNKFLSALSKRIGRRAVGDIGNGQAVDSATAKIINDASASMQTINDDSYIKFIDGDNIIYRIKEGTDDRGREIWRQTIVSRAEANTNGLPFDASTREVPPLTVGKVSKLSRRNTGEFMHIASPETIGQKLGKHFKTAAINAGIEKEYEKTVDSVKKYGTAGIAGGLLGGGVGLGLSALTGLPGGPIVGAAVGAIGNIARKSKTVNEALFGKIVGVDEDGNEEREGGFIDAEVQKAVKKYVPSMAKFGLGGAAVGLLTPLGPVGGAIIGSAIGFMKKSDDFSGFLFGDEGIFSLEDKEKFKKALPNMGLGAAAGALTGLLGGPFGLVGGALVGTAGGFLSTTDKFKELVLGKEYDTGKQDKDGNPIIARHGGLLGAIKSITLDPVKNGVKYLKNTMVDFVQKDIMTPLKNGVKPIANMFKNMFESIGKGVTGVINHFFETKIGVPIQEFVTDKFLKPIEKAAKTVVSFPFKFMGSIVSAPFKLLGFVGNNIRANQIKSGKDFGSTAEERLAWRDQHKIRSRKLFGASILKRFDGTLFNSDGYRTADENIAAEDDNGIESLIQSVTQMSALRGNRSKAITDTSKTIRDLVTSQFDDAGAPGMGASGRILAALRNGKTDKAFKLISTLKSRDGKALSTDAANALINSLRDPLQEYTYLTGGKRISDTEINEVNKKLNEFGFRRSKSGNYDYDDILKLLKSERTGRQKTGEWSIEKTVDKQIEASSVNTQSIVDTIGGVAGTLQNILYYISNGQAGNIVTDEIHIKHDSNGNKVTRRVKDINGDDIKDEYGNFVEEDVRLDSNLSNRTRSKINKVQSRVYENAVNIPVAARTRMNINTDKYRKLVSSLEGFGYDTRSINNFTQDQAVNLADKTSFTIIKRLGELKKNGCIITDDVVAALSNSENVKLSRRGVFGRKQSLFDDIYDYIMTVRKLTSVERANKLANMYSGDWDNLNLVINTIRSTKYMKLHDVLIKDVLDDSTFQLIITASYGSLKSILSYMETHPSYTLRYSLKDALSKNGVHIYTEGRTSNRETNKENSEEEVTNRAFGRRPVNRAERAVVSKDELIIDPYDIGSYARGKYVQDLDSLYSDLGYTEEQKTERELAAKFDNLIMERRNSNGKRIKKRKNFDFLLQQYINQSKLIEDSDIAEEDKNKAITEQTELLSQIKTYLSYNTTDDGDVVKKLIDKRGQVYVNKHDPANKKGLKEGQVNNQNNTLLEKISNAIGKINYVFTEKPINKEGDTISSITGRILGKVGKVLLGGTLAGGAIATIGKLLTGKDITGSVKNWWDDTAKPVASQVWSEKLKPFFTTTVPGIASNAWNGIVNFGSGIKDWVAQNAPAIGSALGNGALFTAKLITEAAPSALASFWTGLEDMTGLNSSGNALSLGERLGLGWVKSVLKGSNGTLLKNINLRLPGVGGKLISKAVNGATTVAGKAMGATSNLLRTNRYLYNGLRNGELNGIDKFISQEGAGVLDLSTGVYSPSNINAINPTYNTVSGQLQDSMQNYLTKDRLLRQGMTESEAAKFISDNNGIAALASNNFSRRQVRSIVSDAALTAARNGGSATEVVQSISKNRIQGAVAKFFTRFADWVEPYIKNVIKSAGKEIPEDAGRLVIARIKSANFFKKIWAKILKDSQKLMTKLGAGVATGGLVTAVFAVLDFVNGFGMDAKSILGITTEPTFFQRLVAAVINVITGATALIPPELISSVMFDYVLKDIDVAGITSARTNSRNIVDALNEYIGANVLTVDSYNRAIKGETNLWNATIGGLIEKANGTSPEDTIRNIRTAALKQGIKLTDADIEKFKTASLDANGNLVFGDGTTSSVGSKITSEQAVQEADNLGVDIGQNTETNSYLERITNSIEGLFSYFTGDSAEQISTTDYVTTNKDETDFIKDIAKSFGYTYEEAAAKLAAGEIYGLSGQGSGRYSQKDKSINMRYNKPGDRIYQDINTSGCGPIAATNLINRHIKGGMGLVTPNEAAEYALKHGYKETNGGTLPSYFKDYFAKNDISSYITSNKSDMKRAIQNGQQVVLMGKDPSYGMGNTPYGPNPHYVVATGIRGSDIVVDNPEENNEYVTYDAKDTISKSTKAIVTNSKYGMGGMPIIMNLPAAGSTVSDAVNAENERKNSMTDDKQGHKTDSYGNVYHYPYTVKSSSVSDIPFYKALSSISTNSFGINDINNGEVNYTSIIQNGIDSLFNGKYNNIDSIVAKHSSGNMTASPFGLNTNVTYGIKMYLTKLLGKVKSAASKDKFNLYSLLQNQGTLENVKKAFSSIFIKNDNKAVKDLMATNNSRDLYQKGFLNYTSNIADFYNDKNKSAYHTIDNTVDSLPLYLSYVTSLLDTGKESNLTRSEVALDSIIKLFANASRLNIFSKTYKSILNAAENTGFTPRQRLMAEGLFNMPDNIFFTDNTGMQSSYGLYSKEYDNFMHTVLAESDDSFNQKYLQTGSNKKWKDSTSNLKNKIQPFMDRFIRSIFTLDSLLSNDYNNMDSNISANAVQDRPLGSLSDRLSSLTGNEDVPYESTLESLKLNPQDSTRENILSDTDKTFRTLLNDTLKETYKTSPNYITPEFIVNLYKKLVSKAVSTYPELYGFTSSFNNHIRDELKKYGITYNPSSANSVPTLNDYDDASQYNISRALLKIIKNITPNNSNKNWEDYYKSVASKSNNGYGLSSLAGAFFNWNNDSNNFEDFFSNLKDTEKSDLQSAVLNPIFTAYNNNNQSDVNNALSQKIDSLIWGPTADFLNRNLPKSSIVLDENNGGRSRYYRSHVFSKEDINYLTNFYQNTLLSSVLSDIPGFTGTHSIREILNSSDQNVNFVDLRSFKTLIDRLNHSTENLSLTSSINLDKYGNFSSSGEKTTPKSIISNLLSFINNPENNSSLKTVTSGDDDNTNGIIGDNISILSNLTPIEQKQLELQALVDMPTKTTKDHFDYLRYAFSHNGPMPLEMFDNLYLQTDANDGADVTARINKYFTPEYKKLAAKNFSANALEIFNNLNGRHFDYLPSGVPESEQIRYALNQVKNNPEEIFRYLPNYKYSQLVNDLTNMNSELSAPSQNATYKSVYGPLVNYLIPEYTKRNSALATMLGDIRLTAKTSGATDERGNIIQSSELNEMSFDKMAFEDLSVFSNITAGEANGFIKAKYDANGAKNTSWDRPLLNMGSVFVNMANKYKVNPRFVLAVMWQEFNLGSQHLASEHLRKFNFISIMNRGQQGASGMWDFGSGSMTCSGVTLNQCTDYKGAIENAFKFFSQVSFAKRSQRTLFSLNYKNGYSFAGGIADWINRMITYMNEFTPNAKATYINPTDGELNYFKGIEGSSYLTDTLPEQTSAEEPSNILEAVWNIVKGIFGINAVKFFDSGFADDMSNPSSPLASKYFNTSKFTSARNFFNQAFEDTEGNGGIYSGVSSGFGPRNLSVKGYNLGQHYGIDLTSTAGDRTLIRTPVSGTVLDSGFRDDGYGNRVLLLDDNSTDPHVHLFGHLSALASSLPKTNGTVSRGDIIGKMGTTGLSTGNHLHYGVQVPSATNPTLISDKYFGSKSGYSGVANDGLTWEANTTNDNFNSEYGWINPDQYIAEYDQKMIPDASSVNSDEISAVLDKVVPTVLNSDVAKTVVPPAITNKVETGMGSGKTSISDELVKQGLKKAYASDNSGVGGSTKDIKLSPAAAAIVGNATKNAANKKQVDTTNNYRSGKGGAAIPAPGEELEVLKQISSTLIAIDKKTAANNEFLVAFLKAVQNGEISAKSPTFNNIMNALSGAGGTSSTIDSSTNTLISTMTNIVRQ